MFTGIIETTARVVKIEKENTNYHFTLEVPFGDELAIDQSMAHDGCCLTVVKVDKEKKQYVVTAMDETMLKTNLSTWQVGTEVNVERSMRMDGRFDGHIVQGHVDQTARCTKVVDDNGSWRFYFEYAYDKDKLFSSSPKIGERDPNRRSATASGAKGGGVCSSFITVPKGSISINGVSLTVVDSEPGMFSVAIIPYTYQVTNFHNFKPGTVVNIEFDVFGKYVQRLLEQYLAARGE
ncbi:MAG: riboflavin synthase [Bacteroidales bacterium]|nr:riboflavin synthase [Bacteroidales bacterium]